MGKVILITGIHGVGKGYIAEQLKNKISIPVYTASELIRQSGVFIENDKRTKNIKSNQNQLLYAIHCFVHDDVFILDGHTCLINANHEIEGIDTEIFRQMDLIGIISIYDDIQAIQERMYQRNQLYFENSFLEKFQNCELDSSKKLAKTLNVPFLSFKNNSNIDSLVDFIEEPSIRK